jgi:23S rRNA (pseudouridine1915-N3)-methyltransferase
VKIKLIVIGKTDQAYLQEGVTVYHKRIPHYVPFEYLEIPDIRNTRKLSEGQQKEKEGELVLSRVKDGDALILLDEKGKTFSSVEFARFLEKNMLGGTKNLVFVVGGPYGFSDAVYTKAVEKVSLSAMTFPHQLIRLIFSEQLYRALTILKGEPYHHE